VKSFYLYNPDLKFPIAETTNVLNLAKVATYSVLYLDYALYFES